MSGSVVSCNGLEPIWLTSIAKRTMGLSRGLVGRTSRVTILADEIAKSARIHKGCKNMGPIGMRQNQWHTG